MNYLAAIVLYFSREYLNCTTFASIPASKPRQSRPVRAIKKRVHLASEGTNEHVCTNFVAVQTPSNCPELIEQEQALYAQSPS